MRHDRSRLLRADGFNQLAETADGYCLYNVHDLYVGRSIAVYGEYAAIEARMLRALCSPGDVVIEAGANFGTHTVGLARHVGASGRVVAFEPQRLVFQALCANIALNSLANVDCYWAAVGRAPGMARAPELDFAAENNFGGVSLLGAAEGSRVPQVALDQFGLPRAALLKVDVEGMELDVLEGARTLLQRLRPRLYVENDRPERSEPLLRFLDAMGYRLYWHAPRLFNPGNFYGRGENLFGEVVSLNVVGVPREDGFVPEGLPALTDVAAHPLRR